MRDDRLRTILTARTTNPGAIAEAAAQRRRPGSVLGDHGRLMMIAADHPARGALGAGDRPMAMADRADLLDRLCLALSRPGVNGVLGTPDIIEDLLLLGALDDKVVVGSMNRGGLAGSVFELDDRFTAYDAAALAGMRYEGGKMLLRIDSADPATVRTIEACGRAVSELAGHRLLAMIEPFLSGRINGKLHNALDADAMTKAMTVAAGIGTTSAYSWLKVPIVPDMARVMAATTLPAVILGGEVNVDPDAAFEQWRAALALPTVHGLVVGRSLLYPPDDDVAGAVDTAVSLF
jgi:hypothetical protein